MQDPAPAPRPRRLRFSLRSLLLLSTVVALLCGAFGWWWAATVKSRMPLYERADSTYAASYYAPGYRAPGNTIRIGPMVRNDRDGTVRAAENAPATFKPSLSADCLAAAPWLDVAQVELTCVPGDFEVRRLRVFDHQTHRILSEDRAPLGYRHYPPGRVTKNHVVRLFGLGEELPESVDVWLDIKSRPPDSPTFTLDPTVGAGVHSGGLRMRLIDRREGKWNWRPKKGFHADFDHRGVTFLYELSGAHTSPSSSGAWSILVVGADGEETEPGWMGERLEGGQRTLLIDLSPDEIDHFVIRPYAEPTKFFFADVPLPAASGRPFAPPPVARAAIGGEEFDAMLPDFAPLDVRLSVRRGSWANGAASNVGRSAAVLARNGEPDDRDRVTTLAYWTRGVAARIEMSPIGDNSAIGRSHGGSGSSGGEKQSTAGYEKYMAPLEAIDEVEVRLAP
ncbi:hypothetical protein Mal64_34410 [Pseudobythopirellula maris]|uniref:Uncharacterized protein n=1 Tax=Pseudobythopirellula maris TaxID=2527991 RepID=A0A5C5ZH17_9BACT|nr:hypothetical protein [Pseudobythopirellula maris]TWT86614.1 hypothetical protein Mal64_34410 [Pseudobythopirellula maris]